jgi:head-tail adaptor
MKRPSLEQLRSSRLTRADLLAWVVTRGADGEPLLTTEEFHSLWKDAREVAQKESAGAVGDPFARRLTGRR